MSECDFCGMDCGHRVVELESLRRWKAEALTVLAEWEKAWDASGRPGRLGESKAAAVRELLASEPT